MQHLSEFKTLFLSLLLVFQFGSVAADQASSSKETTYPAALENRPVRMACNVFPPQKIALPSETDFPGYDLELIQAAFLSQGLTTEFGFFPWKRAYLLVKSGDYDGLCSCSWLPEREQDFLYSQEMGRVAKGVFTLDEQSYAQLSDLRGKSVGVVSGYNLEDELRAAGVFNIQSVISDDLLFNLLSYRRVDVIYSYESTIRALMKNQQRVGVIKYSELERAPYYMCVTRDGKHSGAILHKFNRGLQVLRDSERYEQIIQRYLSR